MRRPLLVRVFGVGLAAAVAALTLVLAATGRLALYISPDSAWFATAMAVVMLVGAVASFALPLGAEGGAEAGGEHEHAHGAAGAAGIPAHPSVHPAEVVASGLGSDNPGRMNAEAGDSSGAHGRHSGGRWPFEPDESGPGEAGPGRRRRRTRPGFADAAGLAGGALAVVVVAAGVLVPPATLSAELAMSRDTGVPPLFAGADTVALASMGDTASFGIGEWASVFATTTNPDAFDGTTVTLTGFATPATGGAQSDGGFRITRLVVTHCIIDAQPASLPVQVVAARTADAAGSNVPETGEWVTVTGTVRDLGGRLVIDATDLAVVAEPEDPYEF